MRQTILALVAAAVLLAAMSPAHADDRKAEIQRSAAAKRAFEKQTGYPHGRAGYVVDHIIPLACGGPDKPINMQWQTISDAKAKDRWERKDCSIWYPKTPPSVQAR